MKCFILSYQILFLIKKEIGIFLAYINCNRHIVSYYFFNMSELNQLNVTEEQLTNSMTNMLFSSLTNVIMIIAGFIYLIVTISFSLTKKMQY